MKICGLPSGEWVINEAAFLQKGETLLEFITQVDKETERANTERRGRCICRCLARPLSEHLSDGSFPLSGRKWGHPLRHSGSIGRDIQRRIKKTGNKLLGGIRMHEKKRWLRSPPTGNRWGLLGFRIQKVTPFVFYLSNPQERIERTLLMQSSYKTDWPKTEETMSKEGLGIMMV